METNRTEDADAVAQLADMEPGEIEHLRHEARKLREIRRLTKAVETCRMAVDVAKASVREKRKELAEAMHQLDRVLGEKDEYHPLFDKSPLEKLRERIFDTLQFSGGVNAPYLAGLLCAPEEQVERAIKHEWFKVLSDGVVVIAQTED